jgi:hypothetical protein
VFLKLWGLWGYALATMLVALAINLFLIPQYVCRVLEVSLGSYLARGFLKPCLLSLPMAAVMLWFAFTFPVKSWVGVIAAVLLGSVVYILTILGAAAWAQRQKSTWWSLGVVELLHRKYVSREGSL